MKKIVLLFGSILCCASAIAQPIITGAGGPVKLTDAISWYEKYLKPYRINDNNDDNSVKNLSNLVVKEDKNYQYGRWLWYWRQHLDQNGYIVSPAKNIEEYKKVMAANGRAERTTSNPAAWTFQGPDSSEANGEGVGRIAVVAFHPTDSNAFWIGSPGGGAWKTTNNGATWTCMTDMLPNLSVADIKINPLNPNTMYICSGDRDGQDFFGIGVLKSYDGGNTWNNTGISWTSSEYHIANNMLINPLDTNALTLATTYGILKSFDGGATWTQVDTGNFMQVLYRPNDTSIIYATSYYNYATSASAQIHRSMDGGMTWTRMTSLHNIDRISLAVTPANPNIVKALASSYTSANPEGLDGIYSSSDSGTTFTEIYTGGCSGAANLLSFNPDGTGCGGQGFYDLPIAISPLDSNKVYIGGVNAWNSTDGGTTWHIMNQWANYSHGVITIHADKHFMGFNPIAPTRFFETNDGGIYSSYNPVSNGAWTNLTNGLGITQFYSVAVSPVANYEMGGAQDVGTKKVQPGLYEVASGGDGMQSLIDFADATTAYSSSEYGYINILSPVSALYPVDISQNIAAGTVEGNGGWVTPFVFEPTCNTCLLAGYSEVYRSKDRGNSWTSISPSITSTDILRIATTIQDSTTIYTVDDGSGDIHVTHNLGTTWNSISIPYSGNYVSDLVVDPRDSSKFFATFSGYGGPEVAMWKASATSASTGTWTLFNTGLPDVPVNCIAFDYLSRDMYVGTDIGVYYRDSSMSSWQPYFTGMPTVRVNDLQINYRTNELWAATFGRSFWKTTKHTSTLGITVVPFLPEAITIAPNPSQGAFTVTAANLANKNVALRIIDNSGRAVWTSNATIGSNGQVVINAKGLKAGNYLFEVSSDNGIAGREKLVIY